MSRNTRKSAAELTTNALVTLVALLGGIWTATQPIPEWVMPALIVVALVVGVALAYIRGRRKEGLNGA